MDEIERLENEIDDLYIAVQHDWDERHFVTWFIASAWLLGRRWRLSILREAQRMTKSDVTREVALVICPRMHRHRGEPCIHHTRMAVEVIRIVKSSEATETGNEQDE